MVYTPSYVAFEGVFYSIIPKGELHFVGVMFAEEIYEAPGFYFFKELSYVLMEADVFFLGFGVSYVDLGGGGILVSHPQNKVICGVVALK